MSQNFVFGLTALFEIHNSHFFVLTSLEIACRDEIASVDVILVFDKRTNAMKMLFYQRDKPIKCIVSVNDKVRFSEITDNILADVFAKLTKYIFMFFHDNAILSMLSTQLPRNYKSSILYFYC